MPLKQPFIINLPGSPKGALDGLTVRGALIGHLYDQLEDDMSTESSLEVVNAVLRAEPITVDHAIAAVEIDTAGAVTTVRAPSPTR